MTDLVGSAEVAERLGFKHPESVHNLRKRPGSTFPEPLTRLQSGLIWSWQDVEAWIEETGWTKRARS